VRGLAVHCLNHACRHQTVISADDYPDEIEVPSFGLRMKCSKCGGRRVDVRPNWQEIPLTPTRLQVCLRAAQAGDFYGLGSAGLDCFAALATSSTQTRFQCDIRTGWSSASSCEAKPLRKISTFP
jgi:hypothetical protein